MPTLTTYADDWLIDYTNKILYHRDMQMTYAGNTGTAPATKIPTAGSRPGPYSYYLDYWARYEKIGA